MQLCVETELKICNFLMEINKFEKSIEISRQNLNNVNNFEPYIIFKNIDYDSKNEISSNNLKYFLELNSIFSTLLECQNVINLFDKNNNNSLNYPEFLNMILSDERRPIKRINNIIPNSLYIPYPTQFALCRILEKLINFVREIDYLIKDLNNQFDFKINYMYFTIKGENNILNKDCISNFLYKNKRQFNEDDVRRIMKVLDVDKNNEVSLTDLYKFCGFSQNNNNCNNYNQLNNNKNEINNSSLSNNFNKINNNNDINNNNKIKNNYFIENNKDLSYYNFSVEKIKFNPNLDKKNYELIFNFFKKITKYEMEIDKVKIDLSLTNDFNIQDCYKIFINNKYNNEFITITDMKIGLNFLEINPTNEELYLLYKKYAINNNELIEFNEFIEMISSIEKYYKDILFNKKPQNYTPKFNKGDTFSYETKKLLKNLFILIFQSEKELEDYRHEINKCFMLNVREIFKKIDIVNKGNFNVLDLTIFLNSYEFPCVQKDIDLLFARFDREKKGNIDLNCFLYEFYPRLK